MITQTLTRALAGVALAAVAAPAFAGSFYLQEQSTRGAGRAYSGEAADTGVSSLWWNPAAIARSGREVYVGLHGLLLDSEVQNAGSTLTYPNGATVPVGGEATGASPIESGLVPNAAFAMPIGDRFAVGVAVQAPYNFTTKYRTNAFSRYDALTSELRTVNVDVAGAVQVTDWLDLGVGVDAQYADARLSSALPNLSPQLPDGTNQLEGDGWNYGWNAGAQMHFGRLDLGLGYRSKIEHELDGDVVISGLLGPLAAANVATEGQASFTTPWFAFLSARYALTDKLTLNGQVNRIGWSEFEAITVDYPGGGDRIVQDYKDVTTGAIGVDYKVNDITTLRAGVAYDPTPTRDDERTARIPDGDRWLYSAGATFQARPGLSIDAAVTYIDLKDASIDSTRTFYQGSGADVTSHLLGEVEGNGVGVSLGARWAF